MRDAWQPPVFYTGPLGMRMQADGGHAGRGTSGHTGRRTTGHAGRGTTGHAGRRTGAVRTPS